MPMIETGPEVTANLHGPRAKVQTERLRFNILPVAWAGCAKGSVGYWDCLDWRRSIASSWQSTVGEPWVHSPCSPCPVLYFC
jgi:hypothetical protein